MAAMTITSSPHQQFGVVREPASGRADNNNFSSKSPYDRECGLYRHSMATM